jgi:hypothetical protein
MASTPSTCSADPLHLLEEQAGQDHRNLGARPRASWHDLAQRLHRVQRSHDRRDPRRVGAITLLEVRRHHTGDAELDAGDLPEHPQARALLGGQRLGRAAALADVGGHPRKPRARNQVMKVAGPVGQVLLLHATGSSSICVILGLGYGGLVLALGQLFGKVGERTPSWVVAAATLAVAALFQPVRRRIQQAVDRRFNRGKYNATQTIQAFSTRLRDQVDLDTLSTELLAVVDQTMEPTRVSLWLRPSPHGSSGPARHAARPTTWSY